MRLKVKEVSKSFAGLEAVGKISLEIGGGEIRGLVGPNGAGKTTLFNLICRILDCDSGEIIFDDVDITDLPIWTVYMLGISRTFQIPRYFTRLTVLGNVMMGAERSFGTGFGNILFRTSKARKDEAAMIDASMERLRLVGLSDKAKSGVSSLTTGEIRLLELARALVANPKLLLLDEPTGGLNEAETDQMGQVLIDINNKGVPIFLIEHNMRFVMRICHQITFMNFGQKIAEGTPREIQDNPKVVESYLGV